MSTITTLAERCIDAWNQTDPAARRDAVDGLFSPDARYVDPQVEAQGREQTTRRSTPSRHSSRASRSAWPAPVDVHHDQVRFGWELGPQDGPAPIAGPDVAVADPEAAWSWCSASSTASPRPATRRA